MKTLVLFALGILLGLLAFLPTSASNNSGLYEFGDWGGQLGSPYSGGNNPLIDWKDLETADGVYNWTPMDNALNMANAAGKQAVPRVYTNILGEHQATPQWFFDAGGAFYYPAGNGVKSPVPWDNLYKQEFGQFLTALGARYNGNTKIRFFQTNAGGGAFAESWLGENQPAGYTSQLHIDTQKFWIDKWRAALPITNLAIMVNELGDPIVQDVSAYANSKRFYLQTNQPYIAQQLIDTFNLHDATTKIVMEIENAGCQQSKLSTGFQSMIDTVLGYAFDIDYLMLCWESFADGPTAATLPNVQAQLRPTCMDCDGDLSTDAKELYLGTNPNDNCGLNAWPPDIDNNNAITNLDMLPALNNWGLPVTDANRRADLAGDGVVINNLDLLPILNQWLVTCTP